RDLALAAAERERDIVEVIDCLHSGGVEPILIKGWTAARHYAEPGLRPYGDIDVSVYPEQLDTAKNLLNSAAFPTWLVDLHGGVPDLVDRGWSMLFQRSQLLQLGETEVRVLSPEDHLRLLCLHLARHGAYRPLWLCDVAAALEARPADFD